MKSARFKGAISRKIIPNRSVRIQQGAELAQGQQQGAEMAQEQKQLMEDQQHQHHYRNCEKIAWNLCWNPSLNAVLRGSRDRCLGYELSERLLNHLFDESVSVRGGLDPELLPKGLEIAQHKRELVGHYQLPSTPVVDMAEEADEKKVEMENAVALEECWKEFFRPVLFQKKLADLREEMKTRLKSFNDNRYYADLFLEALNPQSVTRETDRIGNYYSVTYPGALDKLCHMSTSEIVNMIKDGLNDKYQTILDKLLQEKNNHFLINLLLMKIYYNDDLAIFLKKINKLDDILKKLTPEQFNNLFDPIDYRKKTIVTEWPDKSNATPETQTVKLISHSGAAVSEPWRPDFLLIALLDDMDCRDEDFLFMRDKRFSDVFQKFLRADRENIPYLAERLVKKDPAVLFDLTREIHVLGNDHFPLKKVSAFSEFIKTYKMLLQKYETKQGINLSNYINDDFIIQAILNQIKTDDQQRFTLETALYHILRIIEINIEQRTLEQQLIIFDAHKNENNPWIDVSDADYTAFSSAAFQSEFSGKAGPVMFFSKATALNDVKLKINSYSPLYYRHNAAAFWSIIENSPQGLTVLDKCEHTVRDRMNLGGNCYQDAYAYLYIWFQRSLITVSNANEYQEKLDRFIKISHEIFLEENESLLKIKFETAINFLKNANLEEKQESDLFHILNNEEGMSEEDKKKILSIFGKIPCPPNNDKLFGNIVKIKPFQKWLNLNLGFPLLDTIQNSLIACHDFTKIDDIDFLLAASLVQADETSHKLPPGDVENILKNAIKKGILNFVPSCSCEKLTFTHVKNFLEIHPDANFFRMEKIGEYIFIDEHKSAEIALSMSDKPYLFSLSKLSLESRKTILPLTRAVMKGNIDAQDASYLLENIINTFSFGNSRETVLFLVGELAADQANHIDSRLSIYEALAKQIQEKNSINCELIRIFLSQRHRQAAGEYYHPDATIFAVTLGKSFSFYEQCLIFQMICKMPNIENSEQAVRFCLQIKDKNTLIKLLKCFSEKKEIGQIYISMLQYLCENQDNHAWAALFLELLQLKEPQLIAIENYKFLFELEKYLAKKITAHIRQCDPKPTLQEALRYIEIVRDHSSLIPIHLNRFSLSVQEIKEEKVISSEKEKISNRCKKYTVRIQSAYNEDLYKRFEEDNQHSDGEEKSNIPISHLLATKYKMAQRYLSRVSFEGRDDLSPVSHWTGEELYDYCRQFKAIHGNGNEKPNIKDRLFFLAVLREIYYRTKGIFPHAGQMLTLFLTTEGYPKTFSTVDTGEGKSIIAAIEAAYNWGCGEPSAIGTYNTALAQDGYTNAMPFFDFLDIHAKCIGIDVEEKEEPADVIFGEFSDLSLYAQQNSEHYDISGRVYIGDEFDYAFWHDSRTNIVTLKAEMTFSDSPIFCEWILEYAQSQFEEKLDMHACLQGLPDYLEAKINSLKGDANEKNNYRKFLNEIIESDIEANTNDGEEVKGILLASLHAAFNAMHIFNENKDTPAYMVGEVMDKEGKPKRLAQIIQANSRPNPALRWSGLTHYFVQLLIQKEEENVPAENPRLPFIRIDEAASISMDIQATFISRHKRQIGLSGSTGGKKAEEHYRSMGYHIFHIPRLNVKQITENEYAVIGRGEDSRETSFNAYIDEHCTTILNDARQTGGRPVLGFQKNKDTARLYLKAIKNKLEAGNILPKPTTLQYFDGERCKRWVWHNDVVRYEEQSFLYTEAEFIEAAAQNQTLSITTLSQSRGTDITPTHGEGLLVLIGFLAEHDSEEIQMKGRAGRQGARGEVKSILDYHDLPDNLKENQDAGNFKEKVQHWRDTRVANRMNELMLGFFRFNLIAYITETYSRSSKKHLYVDREWRYFLPLLCEYLDREKDLYTLLKDGITVHDKVWHKINKLAHECNLKFEISQEFIEYINKIFNFQLAQLSMDGIENSDLYDPEFIQFLSEFMDHQKVDEIKLHAVPDAIKEVGFYLAMQNQFGQKNFADKVGPCFEILHQVYCLQRRNFLRFNMINNANPLFESERKSLENANDKATQLEAGTLTYDFVNDFCNKLSKYNNAWFRSSDRKERFNNLINQLKAGVKDLSALKVFFLEVHKDVLVDDRTAYARGYWFFARNHSGSRMSHMLAEGLHSLHDSLRNFEEDADEHSAMKKQIEGFIREYLSQSIMHLRAIYNFDSTFLHCTLGQDLQTYLHDLKDQLDQKLTEKDIRQTRSGIYPALNVFLDEVTVLSRELLHPGVSARSEPSLSVRY